MCVGFLVVLSFCVFVKWWVTWEWHHWRRSFWVSQRRTAPLRTCELFGRCSRNKSNRKRCSVSAYRISARTSWKTYTTGPRYSVTSVEDNNSSIKWYYHPCPQMEPSARSGFCYLLRFLLAPKVIFRVPMRAIDCSGLPKCLVLSAVFVWLSILPSILT